MTSPPPVTTTFAEGRYFDLWMLVHFASGVAGGFSNVYFELSPRYLFALAFLLMLAWEGGEYLIGLRESWANRIIDVIVGMAGVFLAERAARAMLPSREVMAFFASLAVALVGLALGVRAYRARRGNALLDLPD